MAVHPDPARRSGVGDGGGVAGQLAHRTPVADTSGNGASRGTAGNVWSYPNIHGDVIATANSTGTKTGTTLTYDPYGNPLGATPDNSTGKYDYGWLGQHQRGLEHEAGLLPIIEMGARQYSPALGRFLETDPIEGGSCNDYDYVCADPVNGLDLDGTYSVDSIDRITAGGWYAVVWDISRQRFSLVSFKPGSSMRRSAGLRQPTRPPRPTGRTSPANPVCRYAGLPTSLSFSSLRDAVISFVATLGVPLRVSLSIQGLVTAVCSADTSLRSGFQGYTGVEVYVSEQGIPGCDRGWC